MKDLLDIFLKIFKIRASKNLLLQHSSHYGLDRIKKERNIWNKNFIRFSEYFNTRHI